MGNSSGCIYSIKTRDKGNNLAWHESTTALLETGAGTFPAMKQVIEPNHQVLSKKTGAELWCSYAVYLECVL